MTFAPIARAATSLSRSLSNTMTSAPRPAATSAELPPATPPPSTTTWPRFAAARRLTRFPCRPAAGAAGRRVLHRRSGRRCRSSARAAAGGRARSSTVSNATRGESDVAQAARELRQRREMQVAEQQVILAQALEVGLDRLLDLHDQLRPSRTVHPRSAARSRRHREKFGHHNRSSRPRRVSTNTSCPPRTSSTQAAGMSPTRPSRGFNSRGMPIRMGCPFT